MTVLVGAPRDTFDDSLERDAWKRYCDGRNLSCWMQAQKAPIDCVVSNSTGKMVAVELARTSQWTGHGDYSGAAVVIPHRKFKYFRHTVGPLYGDDNTMITDQGYYVLFNASRTRAVILRFTDLVRDESTFPTDTQPLNGEPCKVVLVPPSYVIQQLSL